MIFIYKILTNILYPFFIIIIYLRKFLTKDDKTRYKEKIFISNFNKLKKKENVIWFHAASVGEFKSILPIIYQLNKFKIKLNFLITTTTLSSSIVAKQEIKFLRNVEHRFFPLDVGFLINNFLDNCKPKAIFFVDSEIWPNLLLNAKKRKIPLALINARITNKTFKRWILFPNTAKKIFGLFDLCLCSNFETKKYLKELNAKNVYFNGNIKLISTINKKKMLIQNKNLLANKHFWLAASTHDQEEVFCLKVHQEIKKKIRNIITIIAPRHIERVKEIKTYAEHSNLKTQIINKHGRILKDKEILIINSLGYLNTYFQHAKSVFIGKSLNKKLIQDGGQNPIDAAKLGCKVYHGPYVYNFKDIYEILKKNNISTKIKNFKELSKNLLKDLKKSSKKNKKNSLLIDKYGKKTLVKTMRYLNKFLLDAVK